MKPITHKDYMANSSKLHDQYYAQFTTKETESFIHDYIGMNKLLTSTCKHLNDVVKMQNHGWIWDYSPINLKLARELGAVGKNALPSPATRTCIGKACARQLMKRKAS